jgi:flagellar protein FliS
MNAHTATKAYATIEIESGVHGADPHKLVVMLYQGALLAIANAKNAMLRNDVAAKAQAISKAIQIIDEGLRASLDKNVGGQLALNLDALYGYMCVRVLAASASNNTAPLDEVTRLLSELKGAWDSIRPIVMAQAQQAAPVPAPQSKQPALVYGRM